MSSLFALDSSSLFATEIVNRIGWLLLHSLWQFALIGVLSSVVHRLQQRSSSSTRYVSQLAILSLLVWVPLLTWPLTASVATESSQRSTQSPSVASLNVGPMIPHENPTTAGGVETDSLVNQPPDSPGPAPRAPGNSQFALPQSARLLNVDLAEQLQSWFPGIVLFWCTGVLLFSMRPLWSWWVIQQLKTQGVAPVTEVIQLALDQLCKRCRIVQRVRVLQSTRVETPIVVGCLRCVILLPASMVGGLPLAQLEAILAHELAHVKRFDFLVNLLQTLLETCFFYHPGVWWISRRVRIEREYCCDDLAVATLGSKVEYGRALLAVEEQRKVKPSLLALGVQDGSLLKRILRLAAQSSQESQPSGSGLAVMGMTGLSLLALVVGVLEVSSTPTATASSTSAEEFEPFGLREHWIAQDVRWVNHDQDLVSIAWQGGMNVRRWDVATRQMLSEIKLEADVAGQEAMHDSFKLTADGRRVIGVMDQYVGVWDSETGKLLQKLLIPKEEWSYDTVRCLTCSPDGSIIVAGLETTYEKLTRFYPSFGIVWDANTGEVLSRFEQAGGFEFAEIVLTSDGEQFLTLSGGQKIGLWESRTGRLIRDLSAVVRDWQSPAPEMINNLMVTGIALSPDEKQLAIGGTFGIRTVDLESGMIERTIDAPYRYNSAQLVYAPDGSALARFGARRDNADEDSVLIWSTNDFHQMSEIMSDASQVRFSSDGKKLAAAESDFYEALSVWPVSDIEIQGPMPSTSYERIDRVEENTHEVGPGAQEFADRWKPEWGPTVQGMQYGLAMTTESNPFARGEQVRMVAFLRNTSDQAVRISTRPDMFGNPVQISDASGQQVTLESLKLLGPCSHYHEVLQPGETFGPLYLNVGLGPNPLPNKQVWASYWPEPAVGESIVSHSINVRYKDPKIEPAFGPGEVWNEVSLTSGSIKVMVTDKGAD